MYVTDIVGGSRITVVVTVGENRLEFVTNSANITDKSLLKMCEKKFCVMLEPIMKDGKMLSLSPSETMKYELYCFNPQEEKLYMWDDVSPQMAQLRSGEKYMIMYSSTNARPVNRRKTFRQYVGIQGEVRYGISPDSVGAIIKDVSAGGFAIVVDKPAVDLAPSTIIHASFTDEALNVSFNMNGILVRTEEVDHGRIIIGCKLTAESAALGKYVREKERENLKKHSS